MPATMRKKLLHRVADAIEDRADDINGGMKSSGIGPDGGDYSFNFYMETKHVSLARGTHKIQRLGV